MAVSVPPDSQYDEAVAMPKSVTITAPRPTYEEVAKSLGISKRRQKAIDEMAEEIIKQLRANESATIRTVVEPEKRRKRASAA
jgi:thiamine pyrophosphate-dependent acetolactate synthase large subunit-like protein